jgi:alpha-1,6-mannosyltransferase
VGTVTPRATPARKGVLLLSAPGYVALFLIHMRNSLAPLRSGAVPPDLGYGASASPVLQLLQILCLAYLFAIYGMTLWNWRRLKLSRPAVAWGAVAIALFAWSLLPANSSDVLEYIGFGRVAAIYHANPYQHTYSEFTDAFAPLVTWDEPMPYGPVVLPIFAAAGIVSEHHLFGAIYLIKACWLVVHLLNAWLIVGLASALSIDPEYALFVFAFNPIVLLEQLGNGHNDGIMILCGLLALTAFQRGRDRTAIVFASLGALLKLFGLLWLAGIVALMARRRQWRALAEGLGLALAGAVALAWLSPGYIEALTVGNSQWLYSEDSIHTLIISGLIALSAAVHRAWQYEEAFRADRLVFTALFVAVCARRYLAIRDMRSLVREVGHVSLVLLLGFAVSVYPWYMAWLVPMAALSDSIPLRRTIVVSCAAVLVLYAFPYAVLADARLHVLWSALRIVAAFGVPLAFWAVGAAAGTRRHVPVLDPAAALRI